MHRLTCLTANRLVGRMLDVTDVGPLIKTRMPFTGSAKPSITPESRSSKPPASATARVQKRNESNTGSVDPSRTAAHQLKRQPELSEEEARVAVESSASQLSRDAELAALRQLQVRIACLRFGFDVRLT